MLEGRDSAPDAFLHFGVGGSDVFEVRSGVFLNVCLGVWADASGAESDIALLYMLNNLPLQQ